MLEQLKKVNKHHIYSVKEDAFSVYGQVLSGYDFKTLCDVAIKETECPVEGTAYVAGCPAFEALPVAKELEARIYGEMEIQMGYCNGQNSLLNGLEYHRGSEVLVAASPLVLLLATMTDMKNEYALDSKCMKAFYVEAGEAVELYATTLHFAPCRAVKQGFRSVIVLPKGTNMPLKDGKPATGGEDRLLTMKNKWLLAHPDSGMDKYGAFMGISGENIEISPI